MIGVHPQLLWSTRRCRRCGSPADGARAAPPPARRAKNCDISSSSASGRVTVAAGSGVMAGSTRNCGGVRRVGVPTAGTTRNCMTWPVVAGSATRSPRPGRRRRTARRARRCGGRSCPTGTLVKSTIMSARSARPIRSRLPLSAVRLTGAARKPPSLPICQTSTPGIVAEVEDQEARLAAVEEAEAVAPLLDVRNGQVLPLTMIMLPKNSGFQIGEMSVSGMYGPGDAVEERAGVGVEERAVGVERAVLDGDRDLVVRLVRRERVALAAAPGRAARPAWPVRRVEHSLVAGGPPRMR